MTCMNCGSENDVTDFTLENEKYALCVDCRLKLATGQLKLKKAEVGRPALGVTKKVSLTLPEKEWVWFDEKADGNRSQFLRGLVWDAQSPENEGNKHACLGYVIAGAKKLGYEDENIQELVRAIYGEFDWKSVPAAEKLYKESEY